MRRHLGAITNALVVLLVAYALLRPTGPVGASVMRWREESARRTAVRELWTDLSSSARIARSVAPVVLVEFADYECRICRAQHDMFKRLGGTPGIGSVVVRHYPLSRYAPSEGAARAAICAEEQGRFPEMHDRLLATEAWVTDANWTREASAVGIADLDAFEACLSSPKTTARLQSDIELARRLGVTGTPAYAHLEEGLIIGSLQDSVFLRFARISGR